VLRTAHEAGAERLVLCDTNGGTLPHFVDDVIKAVHSTIPNAEVGVHFHNAAGTAVASSLASVASGARQIQGCVNGYGERTGNADLCAIIPDLAI
jgi:2-isopropylmalate synthase